MDRQETMVVNEKTGGQKGVKLARFDLIPPESLIALAEHYGRGAEKHGDRNWERGYNWTLSFGAMMRHAWLFFSGEDIDEETGGHHLAAVAWHAFTLMEFGRTHPELDDRPSTRRLAAQLKELETQTASMSVRELFKTMFGFQQEYPLSFAENSLMEAEVDA